MKDITDNQTDYSYKYTISLCSAIENFTKNKQKSNPNVFIYKNSDLRFALERAMYFYYINKESLFKIFKEFNDGQILKEVIVEDYTEKEILLNMCDISKENIIIKEESIKIKIKKTLRNILRLFILITQINKFAEYTRTIVNNLLLNSSSAEICFFVERKKFVQYTKDIIQNINISSQYISYEDKSIEYAKENKLPFIKIWSKLYFIERYSKKKDILYKFVLSERYDLLENIIKKIKPKIKSIVVVEGNAPYDEIVNRLCKKYNIQCICIQQGWSPIVHNGFRNMSYSKMLIWGKGFQELLMPYNQNQKFIVTGSHNINTSHSNNIVTDKKENVIIFFVQEQSRLIDDKKLFIFANLINRVAKEFPQTKLVLAGKGGYKISKNVNNTPNITILTDASNIPLQEIMDMGNIIVSAYSTVILESIANNKIPIIFNITSMPNYFPDIASMNAGIEVKNEEEAFIAIKKLLSNCSEIDKFIAPMNKFTNDYFAYNKDTALKNIITEIQKI